MKGKVIISTLVALVIRSRGFINLPARFARSLIKKTYFLTFLTLAAKLRFLCSILINDQKGHALTYLILNLLKTLLGVD